MNDECEIIQDLIPLVNDGVASNSSKELVLKHCKHCTICESMLNKELPIYQEEKLREKWKNSIQKSMLGILLIIILFSCSFTETFDQFNNFILLPLVGVLGYWIIHKYICIFYIAIPFIFILLKVLYQDITLTSIILYAVIYWLLLTYGIMIYLCYAYAFKKERNL
ncbi:MAG: zf-HC2 domain-containing protein [Blautia sp.]|nr:zf-HC2 domain-containing protein [Blautia sp.]